MTTSLNNSRWVLAPKTPSEVLARLADLPPLTVQLLYNRQIHEPSDIQGFFDADASIGNPFQLLGISAAVNRLREAIRRQEDIAVYGDYDADGVTATVLLTQTLKALSAQVRPYIPHRSKEGYGLNNQALAKLAGMGTKLVVTVDCGIRARDEISHAGQLGMEVIVTDHHTPGPQLPPAVAIINPKRPGDPYPHKELAGVGVAFKLAQALLRVQRQVPLQSAASPPKETDLLDLVALGTVADVVPLLGENRTLIRQGLEHLNAPQRPGVLAMMQEARLRPGHVTSESIGFILGPRINAAGRMGSARTSYQILATQSSHQARALATELGQKNRQRQALTADLVSQAQGQIGGEQVDDILIVRGKEYLAGIAGLVAGRLTRRFYRPAIVVEEGETESTASARSIPEFHITQALDQCADLLLRHGGHAEAAGFSIANTCWTEFQDRLRQIAADALAGQALLPTLRIDAKLPLSEANEATLALLTQLEPFGHLNPVPLFLARQVQIHDPTVLKEKHIKFAASQGDTRVDAISFNRPGWIGHLPKQADIVYRLRLNDWTQRPQLHVEDIRPA